MYFIIALVISFLGSIPIGLITLTITQKTIQNGLQSGLMIAFGASVMEFVYTFVALFSLDFFNQNATVANYIKIFAIIIFLGMGIFYLWKKSTPKMQTAPDKKRKDFIRGFLVGAMNMLIVPYWIFFGMWLKSNGLVFDSTFYIIIFSLGATVGALLAFFGYIWLSEYIVKKIKEINRYTNKVIGCMFLGLAIYQAIQFL